MINQNTNRLPLIKGTKKAKIWIPTQIETSRSFCSISDLSSPVKASPVKAVGNPIEIKD